nr:hypothetical protein K4M20_00042 [Agrobacterium fabrum]
MQYQWGQREIVDAVNLPGDFDLVTIVTVNFDKNLHPAIPCLLGELGKEAIGLINHEATGSGLLDRVAGGIEADCRYVGFSKAIEDGLQV